MQYKKEMEEKGYPVTICKSPEEVAKHCNLIITTTSSYKPLLHSVRPGTHITAVGADSPGKQELDPQILSMADIVAVDSKSQCLDHGEVAHSPSTHVIELGEIIADPTLGRTNDNQITVTDLTGVAVQDIQIAKSIIC